MKTTISENHVLVPAISIPLQERVSDRKLNFQGFFNSYCKSNFLPYRALFGFFFLCNFEPDLNVLSVKSY